MPEPSGSWAPTAQDVASLGDAGRVFLDSLLAEFELTAVEGQRALEAAHAKDRLTAIRQVQRNGATGREVAALERLDQGWTKILTGLLTQLKVSR